MTGESYWGCTVVACVAEATMFGFGKNRVYYRFPFFSPNSDSLGLLTLKADGRRRVYGCRPGWCLGGVGSRVSRWCLIGVLANGAWTPIEGFKHFEGF